MIKDILNIDNYETDIRKERRKGEESTQEFFTPYNVVEAMGHKISEEDWADPKKLFLEPSFGNGQFILYIIYRRLQSGVDLYDTLNTLYGTELMRDNVDETKYRVFEMLKQLNIEFDRVKVRNILDKNLVCTDFFKWDFEHWRPL
jgi:hypothetical protein